MGYQAKDGGGNLEFGTSSRALRVTKGSLIADPLLDSLTSINGELLHPLKPGSPAINAGVTQDAPKTDQRGAQRDSQVDIGAFELAALAPSPLMASAPAVSPSFSPVGKQPVAYLSLNDSQGRRAKDSSSKGRDNAGSLVAGAAWTQGVKGGAIAFDGKGDAIKIRNSKDINQGTHRERTVSLWFKADKTDTGSKKQVIYEEGGSDQGLNIYLNQGKLYAGGWNRPRQESGWSGTWLSTNEVSAKPVAPCRFGTARGQSGHSERLARLLGWRAIW